LYAPPAFPRLGDQHPPPSLLEAWRCHDRTPFFFKLEAHHNAICGFGYFADFSVFPEMCMIAEALDVRHVHEAARLQHMGDSRNQPASNC
jgi:hypothetical protein